MEPRRGPSPAKDDPLGFKSGEFRVEDDIMKEEKRYFGAVKPDANFVEDDWD